MENLVSILPQGTAMPFVRIYDRSGKLIMDRVKGIPISEEVNDFRYTYNIDEPDEGCFTITTEDVDLVDHPSFRYKANLSLNWGWIFPDSSQKPIVSPTRRVIVIGHEINFSPDAVQLTINFADSSILLKNLPADYSAASNGLQAYLYSVLKGIPIFSTMTFYDFQKTDLEVDYEKFREEGYFPTNEEIEENKFSNFRPVNWNKALTEDGQNITDEQRIHIPFTKILIGGVKFTPQAAQEMIKKCAFDKTKKNVVFLGAPRNKLAQIKEIFRGAKDGPYMVDGRDGQIDVHNINWNRPIYKKYIYAGGHGELINMNINSALVTESKEVENSTDINEDGSIAIAQNQKHDTFNEDPVEDPDAISGAADIHPTFEGEKAFKYDLEFTGLDSERMLNQNTPSVEAYRPSEYTHGYYAGNKNWDGILTFNSRDEAVRYISNTNNASLNEKLINALTYQYQNYVRVFMKVIENNLNKANPQELTHEETLQVFRGVLILSRGMLEEEVNTLSEGELRYNLWDTSSTLKERFDKYDELEVIARTSEDLLDYLKTVGLLEELYGVIAEKLNMFPELAITKTVRYYDYIDVAEYYYKDMGEHLYSSSNYNTRWDEVVIFNTVLHDLQGQSNITIVEAKPFSGWYNNVFAGQRPTIQYGEPGNTGAPKIKILVTEDITTTYNGINSLLDFDPSKVGNIIHNDVMMNTLWEIDANADVIGDPGLESGMNIYVDYISKKYSGRWHTKKVSHVINQGTGYQCNIEFIQIQRNFGSTTFSIGQDIKQMVGGITDIQAEREKNIKHYMEIKEVAKTQLQAYSRLYPKDRGKSLDLIVTTEDDGSFTTVPATKDIESVVPTISDLIQDR